MPLGANKAAIMGVAGVSTADVVLIYDTDHSNATVASITSGITSAYGEYIFRFYNMNPATDAADFTFQTSIDGGSNYNVLIASTVIGSYHDEQDDNGVFEYFTGSDSTDSSTSFQNICTRVANAADGSAAGELHLFNPSSTTFVKHFWAKVTCMHTSGDDPTRPYTLTQYTSGYFNDADDDVNANHFKISAGNFDGTIKMWGVK